MHLDIDGGINSAFGYKSLHNSLGNFGNVAFGYKALFSNLKDYNVAVGSYALENNLYGEGNVAVGSSALQNNTTGICNSAFGHQALIYNTIGTRNSAFGYRSLYSNTTGTSNSSFGYNALKYNTTGTNNSAFGYYAGDSITTGTNLTCIGFNADASSATATNEITLGDANVATLRCQVTTITALSDFRDKTDINNVEVGLNFVEKLRPVTFKWDKREWYPNGNKDGSKKENILQVGFIAQELKQLQEETNATYLKLVYESNPDKLEATPGNLLVPIVKSIQELSVKLKSLENRICIIENK